MRYKITIQDSALKEIKILRKSGDIQALKKLEKLFMELEEHPTTGTGQVEALKGDKVGLWSRRITGRHRLIYSVNEMEVEVLVISVYGHYDDK